MKKILLLFFALVISLAVFSACDEDSKPSSTPENNNQSSQPDESHPEGSRPDVNQSEFEIESEPDLAPESDSFEDSTPEESDASIESDDPSEASSREEVLPIETGMAFSKASTSYRIAYTKVHAVVPTLKCVVSPEIGITAVYNGRNTQFFDAVTGLYYSYRAGDYTRPCPKGFLSATGTNVVHFIRDEVTGEVTLIKERCTYEEVVRNVIYSSFDRKTYGCYSYGSGNDLYKFDGNSYVICRYAETESSVYEEWWENGFVDFDSKAYGKYGVMKGGEIVIPFEYDSILSYQTADEKGVYACQKDGRTYYLSSDGENLTPEGFACGAAPYQNRAWVFNDEGFGFILEFR